MLGTIPGAGIYTVNKIASKPFPPGVNSLVRKTDLKETHLKSAYSPGGRDQRGEKMQATSDMESDRPSQRGEV